MAHACGTNGETIKIEITLSPDCDECVEVYDKVEEVVESLSNHDTGRVSIRSSNGEVGPRQVGQRLRKLLLARFFIC